MIINCFNIIITMQLLIGQAIYHHPDTQLITHYCTFSKSNGVILNSFMLTGEAIVQLQW